jgi:hypothetical protein
VLLRLTLGRRNALAQSRPRRLARCQLRSYRGEVRSRRLGVCICALVRGGLGLLAPACQCALLSCGRCPAHAYLQRLSLGRGRCELCIGASLLLDESALHVCHALLRRRELCSVAATQGYEGTLGPLSGRSDGDAEAIALRLETSRRVIKKGLARGRRDG